MGVFGRLGDLEGGWQRCSSADSAWMVLARLGPVISAAPPCQKCSQHDHQDWLPAMPPSHVYACACTHADSGTVHSNGTRSYVPTGATAHSGPQEELPDAGVLSCKVALQVRIERWEGAVQWAVYIFFQCRKSHSAVIKRVLSLSKLEHGVQRQSSAGLHECYIMHEAEL